MRTILQTGPKIRKHQEVKIITVIRTEQCEGLVPAVQNKLSFFFALFWHNMLLMNAIQQTDYRNWCMGCILLDKQDQYDWINSNILDETKSVFHSFSDFVSYISYIDPTY